MRDPLMNNANARLEQLRVKARSERTLLSELNDQLGNDLRQLIRPASQLLDDVDMLTGADFLQEPAKYLQQIEAVFHHAVDHRKYIESLLKKYGPDAKLVGR